RLKNGAATVRGEEEGSGGNQGLSPATSVDRRNAGGNCSGLLAWNFKTITAENQCGSGRGDFARASKSPETESGNDGGAQVQNWYQGTPVEISGFAGAKKTYFWVCRFAGPVEISGGVAGAFL
ncbi:hypothetical protein U1Q18_036802, partial [Sarracenia purpurea var. burkii]